MGVSWTVAGSFLIAFVLLTPGITETPEEGLKSAISTVRYPPLADLARIQGDVHLSLKSGEVSVVSGLPLLAKVAVDSAKSLGPILGDADFDLTFHFVVDDTSTSVRTQRTVKRGNAFERVFLRMFRLKTDKVVVDYECVEGIPPPNDLRVSGRLIEAWIHGKGLFCLQTNTVAKVAKR
jgi:hypothetical protein